eukprot:TRINITY_DN3443_c1_g1_i1.p1 TRINITY_DN3443_c1_g1~~TRINITY_DN3443_c1_g1_i1.p1  ORF type:complete len:585 (-),score=153.56 TRINITY_DN3443_c1_g1_i1:46-1800(-)
MQDNKSNDKKTPNNSNLKTPSRQQLVKELLETEKVHMDGVSTFIEQYIKSIKQQNVLDTTTLQKIVVNIELIHSWNVQFYNSLRNRLKKNLEKPFGELFMHMIPVLRQLYAQYNENYQSALNLYKDTLLNNKQFASFVERKRQETGKDFLFYLYMPIQRVIAYDSLVKDILHHTEKDNKDYSNLVSALQSIRALTKHANERAVQRKNIDHVLTIQEMLGDSCPALALPHRRYVYEGPVKIVGEGPRGKEKYFFLFNDILIGAKERTKKREKKYEMEFMVGDMSTVHLVDDYSESDPYRFILKTQGKDYILSTPDKSSWFEFIESTKKNLMKPSLLQKSVISIRDLTENEPLTEVTKEQLIKQIIEWSKMENAEAVLMEIKEFAMIFENSFDTEDEIKNENAFDIHEEEEIKIELKNMSSEKFYHHNKYNDKDSFNHTDKKTNPSNNLNDYNHFPNFSSSSINHHFRDKNEIINNSSNDKNDLNENDLNNSRNHLHLTKSNNDNSSSSSINEKKSTSSSNITPLNNFVHENNENIQLSSNSKSPFSKRKEKEKESNDNSPIVLEKNNNKISPPLIDKKNSIEIKN